MSGLLICGRAEDRLIQRDGVQLHYEIEGSGQPVIILSGGPGFDPAYMKSMAAVLPDRFQRVYLHQRGTGRSQIENLCASNMTLELMIEDVEALRRALRQEKLFLFGHSWGGMLAMAYAAAHPKQVDRLILIDSGGPTMQHTEWFVDNLTSRQQREALIDKSGITAYFFDRDIGLAYSHGGFTSVMNKKVNDVVWDNFGKSYDYDLRAGLRKLRCPVLIVHGQQDPIPAAVAEQIHDLIRSSTLKYIRRCGHFPHIEQPDEFKQIVVGFLDRSL